jgi:hypothetical protein
MKEEEVVEEYIMWTKDAGNMTRVRENVTRVRGNVTRVREMRNACRAFSVKLKETGHLEKIKSICDYNIKTGLK